MRALWLLPLVAGCSEYLLHGQPADDRPAAEAPEATAPEATVPGAEGSTEGTVPRDGCRAPVPDHVDLSHVVWGEEGVHFYVPHATWAFAALHASRQLDGLGPELSLRLSPSYFLATGLKESFLGCSDRTAADPVHPTAVYARKVLADYDGCMQLESTTAWVELCRMYPDDLDCGAVGHADVISALDQAETGRDNVEPSMLAAAWYGVFGIAMLGSHGVDPDGWLAGATDPQATAKLVALIYNRGAWSGEIDAVLAGCADAPIQDCVTPGSIAWDYVDAVGSYTADLEAAVDAGSCYDATVSLDDALAWVDALAPMFPARDPGLAHAAVTDAFLAASGGAERASFQRVGPEVVDALDGAWALALHCPDAQLGYWYGQGCP